MSFLDSIFGGTQSDLDAGNEILQAYYDEASKFPEFTYGSYDAWVTWLNSKVPDYVTFLGNLVKSNYASISVSGAASKAADLANSSEGQATPQAIIQNVSTSGGVNWAAAIPEISINTAKDAEGIVQNVGQGVISTLNATKYLPWILGAGAALYIIVSSSGGKGLKSLLKR